MKPGRNDPCYCGSGKKYKRCHLPLDEQKAAAEPAPPAHKAQEPSSDLNEIVSELGASTWKFKNIRKLLNTKEGQSIIKESPELGELIEENGTLLAFVGSEKEIGDARAKLRPYADEFSRLLEDEVAYASRCEAVFSEEPFVPLRFSHEDLEKAFKEVGVPTTTRGAEEFQRVCFDAILFLANPDVRRILSMELLMLVPSYVKAGRYIDACLISFVAEETLEAEHVPTVFLTRMFRFGWEAWVSEKEEERTALLGEMGLETSAMLQAVPSGEVRLLEREDAAFLLLPQQEIEPHLPLLLEKMRVIVEKFGVRDEPLPPTEQAEAFSIYVPAIREMTRKIFTPERIAKLVEDLRVYRNRLFALGDKSAAGQVMGAINYVQRENEPWLNSFLLNLCAKSVHSLRVGEQETVGEKSGELE